MEFEGVYPAIITPLDETNKLKEEEFIEMALINNAVQNGFSVKKLTNLWIFLNEFEKKFYSI